MQEQYCESRESDQRGKADTAKTAAATALSTLDKAASKGIIHPNNAARRQSPFDQEIKTP